MLPYNAGCIHESIWNSSNSLIMKDVELLMNPVSGFMLCYRRD